MLEAIIGNLAAALIVYLVAVWRLDALTQFFNEQRRARQWRRFGHLARRTIRVALLRAMIQFSYQTRWPPDASSVSGSFADWSEALRQILRRQLGSDPVAPLTEAELRTTEERRIVTVLQNGTPALMWMLRISERVSRLFGTALPAVLEERILEAMWHILEWRRLVKAPEPDATEDGCRRQAASNATTAAATLEAVGALWLELDRHLTSEELAGLPVPRQ